MNHLLGNDQQVSNIIFVDQPVGTGFSYSTDIRDIRHDEEGVSEDMYDFFQVCCCVNYSFSPPDNLYQDK